MYFKLMDFEALNLNIYLPVVLAPLLAGLFAMFFSRIGRTGELKRLEILEKRVNILGKILDHEPQGIEKERIGKELTSIKYEIIDTTKIERTIEEEKAEQYRNTKGNISFWRAYVFFKYPSIPRLKEAWFRHYAFMTIALIMVVSFVPNWLMAGELSLIIATLFLALNVGIAIRSTIVYRRTSGLSNPRVFDDTFDRTFS